MNPSTFNHQFSTSVANSQPCPRPLKRGKTRNRPCDRVERWQPDIGRLNAVARAVILLTKGRYKEAGKIARHNKGGIDSVDKHLNDPRSLAGVLLQELQESFALPSEEESVFKREGDFWTVIYEGQTARLRATRGLQCVACLLRNPGREFHVRELITELVEGAVLAEVTGTGRRESGIEVATTSMGTSCPILDAQAKTECKRRLEELRVDLEEAKRFNEPERASQARNEMHSIAAHLASAVGLGGRDRKTGTEAERARSAVTKRIKESIHRIAEAIPALGHHLAVRIKTGYFCSYNPHPDRPAAWEF